MAKLFEKLEQINPIAEKPETDKNDIIERIYADALNGESYENAATAVADMESLQNFRKNISRLPFKSFHGMAEGMTNLNKLPLKPEEKIKQTEVLLAALSEKTDKFSPRVADLYQTMLAEIQGQAYEPRFDITREKIIELKRSGDLDILFSGEVSWEMKLNRIETRLIDYLAGARALDRREGKEMDDDIREWRGQELKKAPTRPPERKNESRPGVDPMERLKEGERAPAIWSIYPAWGGYYKEQSFSHWDTNRNVWVEDDYSYGDAEITPLSRNENYKKGPVNITMIARVFSGQWTALPIPYTHNLHKIEANGCDCRARKDQNGDIVIMAEGTSGEEIEIKIFLAPDSSKKFSSKVEKIRVPDMPADYCEETNQKLSEIAGKKRGNIARARAIKSYVVGRIRYLAPKDRAEAEYYNNIYRTSPKGFAGAVDETRTGDCDVVNTYFAALCSKLNIPVRHCVGHSVKGKDQAGFSSITSGTGHGWSEVWDEIKKEWARFDATPAGDPNLEDEEQTGGESAPGDYGEPEAVRPTDEQLEELRKKLAERKEELSYTKEERQLAQGAGVELKEARQIVKEISEAEQTRLLSGELVVDALAKLFNAIVESRKNQGLGYTGPVRESEGGEEIENIVQHYIQAKTGEMDPRSRALPTTETKEEKLLGGLDFYFIGDKSGSMQSSAEGERLWQMQRRTAYLIFSSLYRFERNLERAGLQKENSLSVRTQSISFRGNGPEDMDLDKPLSEHFTAQDKVKMWRSLTKQGSGNGDVAALSYVYEQIKNEATEIEKRGGTDNRLRLVIACSDGGPDSPAGVQELAEKIGRFKAIVVGVGLTESAASVPIIYDTAYSRGDIAHDINDLPALVAKHIVLEAVKLFPDKMRENAKQIIENSLAKFKKIK